MELPIDYRDGPFKPKYIDEETPILRRWMIFGSDVRDGTVFISDSNGNDIFTGLNRSQAERIIFSRDQLIDEIISTLNER